MHLIGGVAEIRHCRNIQTRDVRDVKRLYLSGTYYFFFEGKGERN